MSIRNPVTTKKLLHRVLHTYTVLQLKQQERYYVSVFRRKIFFLNRVPYQEAPYWLHTTVRPNISSADIFVPNPSSPPPVQYPFTLYLTISTKLNFMQNFICFYVATNLKFACCADIQLLTSVKLDSKQVHTSKNYFTETNTIAKEPRI